MHPEIAIRPIVLADEATLFEALYHSIHVPAGQPPPPPDIVRAPELAHYVQGWGRAGDRGYLAVEVASQRAVGVVWVRLLVGADRGFGWVNDRTPELGIAVWPEHRGQGVGSDLLRALLGSEAGRGPISLSVSKGNAAQRLYERFGFHVLRDDGDALTMVRPAAGDCS